MGMIATIETILLLLAMLVAVAIVARRLNTAPSILLVVAGIALALLPGLPRIVLAPELVLLRPSAAADLFGRRRHELARISLQPAADHAAGVRLRAVHQRRRGSGGAFCPWHAAGRSASCSAPSWRRPMSVAPLAIIRSLGLPRRLLVVLEGEGLANDATALILYRFAVAAVATGMFSLPPAAGEFALIVVGEIAFGVGIGWVSLRLRRWARDPRVEITMSLMTPYVAFLVPANLGGSGVLATVAAGLFVSWNGPLLIPAATRLQGIFFWDLIVYYLEGFIFLVTGMETRDLIDRPNVVSLHDLGLALLITVVVIVVARFIWVFPAAYVPRWLSPSLRRRDPVPPWQWIFLLAFVGVRGVVSLAAALALPLTTLAGAPFPNRDLIVFVTFGVIVVTLVGQGLVLPGVVRWLALPHDAEDERRRERDAEFTARIEALNVAQDRVDKLAADGQVSADVVAILRARHDHRAGQLPTGANAREAVAAAAELRAELIAAEREYIYRLLQEGQITDEARRRIERELDLEEASLAFKRDGEADVPL